MDKIVAACEGCAGDYICSKRYECKRYAKHLLLMRDFQARARYYIMPDACFLGKYFIELPHNMHIDEYLTDEAM